MNQSVNQVKQVYFGVTALTWLSVAIPLPIFVLYMQARGIDLFQLGIIMGVYSIVIVLLELPTGGLADAIGRKGVALLAHSISLISGIVMLFSFSFAGFLLAMILNGIGRALASGSLDAWFVDSLQEAEPGIDLQPALAQAGTVTLLALGTGTLIGGLLPRFFSALPDEGTALLTPLSTTLILSLMLKILLIFAIIFAVKEKPLVAAGAGNWRSSFSQVPQIVRESLLISRSNRSILLLMAAALVGGFSLAGVETFWQPQFANLLPAGESNNSWIFGLIMAVSFLAGVLGNLFSIPISQRLGHRHAWVASLARGGQGLALILLATQGYIIPASFGFWLFYLNMGVLNSPHETLVNQEIPASRRSAMLSIQSLASYVGGFLGGILLGFIAQHNSINLAWFVAGTISMVSLLLYVGVARRRRRGVNINEQKIPVFDYGQEANAG
jgi:MFS family permease